MPKDWKRYTTAGLTFATIITIGFVMQNGQNDGPQDQLIATANMGDHVAHAALPALGEEMLLIAEVDERVQPVDRLHPDIAAAPAIAAVRAAVFHVFLAPPRGSHPV